MVAIVQRYTHALASGLVPLLSRLSAGTEMSSYGNPQWEFLLGSQEITTFVAVDCDDKDSLVDFDRPLLGCLLRVDMPSAQRRLDETTTIAASGSVTRAASAGFGMMLVSPQARGQGVAKKLLNAAMSAAEDARQRSAQDKDDNDTRKLLAVCTTLGQPVYRKLGFAEVGKVTALKTTVGAAKERMPLPPPDNMRIQTHGSLDRDDSEGSSSSIPENILRDLQRMDALATGWDRRERLRNLLANDPTRSLRSMVVLARSEDENKLEGAAVLRQEGPESPLVVGPVWGSEASVTFSMISALASKLGKEHDPRSLSLLMNDDYPALREQLRDAGFSVGFEFPAMAMDGRPIYEGGDGIGYQALMHPTLG